MTPPPATLCPSVTSPPSQDPVDSPLRLLPGPAELLGRQATQRVSRAAETGGPHAAIHPGTFSLRATFRPRLGLPVRVHCSSPRLVSSYGPQAAAVRGMHGGRSAEALASTPSLSVPTQVKTTPKDSR